MCNIVKNISGFWLIGIYIHKLRIFVLRTDSYGGVEESMDEIDEIDR